MNLAALLDPNPPAPRTVAPPREQWSSGEYRNRPYHHFPILHREGDIPFAVAERIAERYEVCDVLTRGGGGVILVAVDGVTGREVLIKALAGYDVTREDLAEPVEVVAEEIRRARHHLQTERRILVRLHNAGCPAVPLPVDYAFDANPVLKGPHRTAAGQEWRFNDLALMTSEPYLVMNRVPGATLKELLHEDFAGGVEESVALSLIDQAAAVLEKLHEPWELHNGQTWRLIHQDVKPGNLIVDEYGHLTVLDFGGCQVVVDDMLVLHGGYSSGYCAPECGQWDDVPLLPLADTYALASTLFHLLSGIHPRTLIPPERQPWEPRAAEIDTTPMVGRCSNGVVALLNRALSWELEPRFQTVTEFRHALADVRSS